MANRRHFDNSQIDIYGLTDRWFNISKQAVHPTHRQ